MDKKVAEKMVGEVMDAFWEKIGGEDGLKAIVTALAVAGSYGDMMITVVVSKALAAKLESAFKTHPEYPSIKSAKVAKALGAAMIEKYALKMNTLLGKEEDASGGTAA